MESFVPVSPTDDFPLRNLPYGVFSRREQPDKQCIGVAIGDYVVDLGSLASEGLLTGPIMSSRAKQCFSACSTLNEFMGTGKSAWQETRSTLQRLLSSSEGVIRDNESLRQKVLVDRSETTLHMPAAIGDYTDFYTSKQHATNVGTIFRCAWSTCVAVLHR